MFYRYYLTNVIFIYSKENKFTVDVYNVSLIPCDNLLAFREGSQREFRCLVNSNAVPAPTITWYLGSTDITSRAGTDTTSITLTGNRIDNMKTLQCRATNNNKPSKSANTTLNVECKFSDIPSESEYYYKN